MFNWLDRLDRAVFGVKGLRLIYRRIIPWSIAYNLISWALSFVAGPAWRWPIAALLLAAGLAVARLALPMLPPGDPDATGPPAIFEWFRRGRQLP